MESITSIISRDLLDKELQMLKAERPETFNKIMRLYDYKDGSYKIDDIFDYVHTIFNELFTVHSIMGSPGEAVMPVSFLKSNLAHFLLSILYSKERKTLTISEVLNMANAAGKREYTRAWVYKCRDLGQLVGTKKPDGSIFFYEDDVISFLKAKKLLK